MSIYNALATPVPTIAYSILHQAAAGMPPAEYGKSMKDLHDRIARETKEVNNIRGKFYSDTTGRESQTLENSLVQFLHTPISSDTEEVRRIISDSLERYRGQVLERSRAGLASSTESRVVSAPPAGLPERKLFRAGRSQLQDLGFRVSKGAPDIHESLFIMRGTANLDVLEYIVRDRIGISSPPHGKHLRQFAASAYGVYNLAFSAGEMPSPLLVKSFDEMTFHFSKPDGSYGDFRGAMERVLQSLTDELDVAHTGLWQRKLGLGPGREFILRVVRKKAHAAAGVVEWLKDTVDDARVRSALLLKGSLVVKEYLFRFDADE